MTTRSTPKTAPCPSDGEGGAQRSEAEPTEHKAQPEADVGELVARLDSCLGGLDNVTAGAISDAIDLLTTLSSDKARLEGELAKSREWSPNDEDDQWTPAIRAAHPTNLKTPESWSAWNTALEMVGKRRSKYALVDLASWLLARAQRAEAERDALKAELIRAAEWFEGYADGHQAKGAIDKATRNLERANHLRRAAAPLSHGIEERKDG